MDIKKKDSTSYTWLNHFLVIGMPLYIGYGFVAWILTRYGIQTESIRIGGETFAFAPIYNRSGSWIHGHLQIGYDPKLLMGEYIVALIMLFLLVRFMNWYNQTLQISTKWVFCVYPAVSTTLARILAIVFGQYTLDYIYIGYPFYATYDLFDFYLGITVILLAIWLIRAEIRYSRMKKILTADFSWWEKLGWELRFSADALKALVTPKSFWKKIGKRYQYKMVKKVSVSAEAEATEDIRDSDRADGTNVR